MKLLIFLVLVALAVAHPDGGHYDSKYDSFDVDTMTNNDRLLKSYANCFIGIGKCTPEGNDIKTWIPEASKTSCGKCTEKQKVLVAKSIKAIKEKLPEEYETLVKKTDPEGKYSEDLKKYLEKYGS